MKHSTDWEAVSRHYRAGVRSLYNIADEFGISEGAIRKRAKKEGWTRDLSEKIKAAAAEKVRIDAVRTGTCGPAEQEIIEANAAALASKLLEHRKDIQRNRDLVAKLFQEVEGMTEGSDLIEQMVLALQQGDQGKLAEAARKAASLPQRIKGTSELVGAFRVLIALERQALNMDANSDAGQGVAQVSAAATADFLGGS